MERHCKRNQLALAAAIACALVIAVALALFIAKQWRRGGDGTASIGQSFQKAGRHAAAPCEARPWMYDYGTIETRTSEQSLEDEGTSLVMSYQTRGDCRLASWGYLDLAGDVWSCVVDGGTWVDICYLVRGSSTGGCEVNVMHLDAAEIEGMSASGGGA